MILKPTKENLKLVVQKLLEGKVVIFPTDTVFGIGCLATNSASIDKIYKLKKRTKTKSFLLNIANITSIKKIAKVTVIDEKLIKSFMPGALSLILKVKPHSGISDCVVQDGKIGVRIPNNKNLLWILKNIKVPLVSTSCNLSGSSPCLTAAMAERIFGAQVIILDTEEKLSGISSTIIETTGKEISFIREGKIKFGNIKKVIRI